MATLTGEAFVGRQREMGKLKGVLEDALSGLGQLLMLVGEPGIGKTRTAQELAAYAKSRGTQVLWGWCYVDMPEYPLAPPGITAKYSFRTVAGYQHFQDVLYYQPPPSNDRFPPINSSIQSDCETDQECFDRGECYGLFSVWDSSFFNSPVPTSPAGRSLPQPLYSSGLSY
jgi:hypothetical protein